VTPPNKPNALPDEAVEACARASYEAACPPGETPLGGFSRFATWDELGDDSRLREIARARAALSALPSAGFAVEPKDAVHAAFVEGFRHSIKMTEADRDFEGNEKTGPWSREEIHAVRARAREETDPLLRRVLCSFVRRMATDEDIAWAKDQVDRFKAEGASPIRQDEAGKETGG
jgi:hypothetical protein